MILIGLLIRLAEYLEVYFIGLGESKLKENGNNVELKIYKGAYHGFVSVREKEKEFLSNVGNFRNCKPGYITDEGYWFYNNKEWKNMTELETVNAVWKKCGQPGVRIGGTLEQQEQQVRDFVAVGDVASAQKVILGELETQFGGVAKAAGSTMAGSLEQMNNAIGDAQQALGRQLAPAIISMATNITTLANKTEEFFKNLSSEKVELAKKQETYREILAKTSAYKI